MRQIIGASLVNPQREEWIILARQDGEPWGEIAMRWGITEADARRIWLTAVRRGQ